jgi:hypothetical protein
MLNEMQWLNAARTVLQPLAQRAVKLLRRPLPQSELTLPRGELQLPRLGFGRIVASNVQIVVPKEEAPNMFVDLV